MRINTRFFITCSCIFLVFVLAGFWHWGVVVGIMFTIMLSHGIHSPLPQASAVTPFAAQAGSAAGLSGAFFMVVALFLSTVVGATYNGTPYPVAIIAFTKQCTDFCLRAHIP